MQKQEPAELFEVKETTIEIPKKARIFHSILCDCCGESTAESMIKLQGDQKLCLDCYVKYDRFNV